MLNESRDYFKAERERIHELLAGSMPYLPYMRKTVDRLYDLSETLAYDWIHPAATPLFMLRQNALGHASAISAASEHLKGRASEDSEEALRDFDRSAAAVFASIDTLGFALDAVDKLVELYQHQYEEVA